MTLTGVPFACMGRLLEDGTQEAMLTYDFALDGKAIADVDENGDLWIEGFASDFLVDRQDEAFEEGAFERGLKAFLDSNPIMLYHHKYDQALGVFTDAKVIPGQGLWVKGRVDKPAAGSWAEDVFNKIRKGTIKAFSVGGIFRRRMTPQGPRIFDCDLGEISITPFPVNPRTTFAVVAQKAFSNLEGKAEDEVVVEQTDGVTVVETPEQIAAREAEERAAAEAEEQARLEAEEAERVRKEEEIEAARQAEINEVLKPGSIIGEHIKPGSIGTEHLSDELKSRFSELKEPEKPSLEDLGDALQQFEASLEAVAHHVGYVNGGPSGPKLVTNPGNVRTTS